PALGWLLAAAISTVFLTLTKDYFALFFKILLAFGLGTALYHSYRNRVLPASILATLMLSFTGVAAQQAWQARNDYQLAENAFPDRMALALLGKVLRVEQHV